RRWKGEHGNPKTGEGIAEGRLYADRDRTGARKGTIDDRAPCTGSGRGAEEVLPGVALAGRQAAMRHLSPLEGRGFVPERSEPDVHAVHFEVAGGGGELEGTSGLLPAAKIKIERPHPTSWLSTSTVRCVGWT